MNEKNVEFALVIFMAAARMLAGVRLQNGLTNEQLATNAVERNLATREQADRFIAMLDSLPTEPE